MHTLIIAGAKVPTTIKAGDDGRVVNAPLEVAGKTWQVRGCGVWIVKAWRGGATMRTRGEANRFNILLPTPRTLCMDGCTHR